MDEHIIVLLILQSIRIFSPKSLLSLQLDKVDKEFEVSKNTSGLVSLAKTAYKNNIVLDNEKPVACICWARGFMPMFFSCVLADSQNGMHSDCG